MHLSSLKTYSNAKHTPNVWPSKLQSIMVNGLFFQDRIYRNLNFQNSFLLFFSENWMSRESWKACKARKFMNIKIGQNRAILLWPSFTTFFHDYLHSDEELNHWPKILCNCAIQIEKAKHFKWLPWGSVYFRQHFWLLGQK